MSYSLEEKVKWFAVYSRVAVFILQFISNSLIPDHDAGVFLKPLDSSSPKSNLDIIIELLFGGFTHWDSQYFLHIAEYGYTYENTLAFFPLYPLILRHLSYVSLYVLNYTVGCFLNIENLISMHSMLIVVSTIVNSVIFVQSSVVLYRLSLMVLKNEKLAYVSAVLFCVNPASIFFSACYSESLYCYLVFYGLLKIEEKNSLVNYVVVGMTGAVRSNGVLNIGFVVYKYIKMRFFGKAPFFYNFIFNFGVILTVLPFVTFQMYCFAKYCVQNDVILPGFIMNYGRMNNFVFPGGNSSWCKQFIPLAYSYVQKHYWNVGFLNYYEFKQIPNFVLAAPVLYIMIRGTFRFVRHYKFMVLYLGLVQADSKGELPISTFPYIAHGFALTVFAIFMIHIQVSTRLLASSSPVLYWYCSQIMAPSVRESIESNVLTKLRKNDDHFYECSLNKRSRWKTFLLTETFNGYSFFIKWYFFTYFFVGTLMFSNYLPWT